MSGFVAVPAVLPPVRLVCLAHAGGSAMLYRRWVQRLPRGVQVVLLELPGHGSRCRLPAHTEWLGLIDMLLDEVTDQLDDDVPFAVFGHSMGALVGFELIHALRARHATRASLVRRFGIGRTVASQPGDALAQLHT
jgi:surfactin synthase thioesterase subunit